MFAYTSVDGVAYEKLSTVTIVCWYMNGLEYLSRRNISLKLHIPYQKRKPGRGT